MLEALESRVMLSRTWFVAPNGNDKNAGTISQPFLTIQHAAGLAEPGDTVYLRAGTYRETVTPAHSGTASAPITYSAYDNEVVTIDGADLLSGWTKNAGSSSIYSTPQSWDLGEGNNEVFVDGVAMNEAEWPNTAVGAFQPATAAVTAVSATIPGVSSYDSATATLSVSGLPGGAGAWNGATIHFGAGQAWVIQTGTVISSGNGKITFAYIHQSGYETPAVGARIYLTGKLVGLDAAGEWYRDPTTGRLNLRTPKSDSPSSHVVEAKRRRYALDLNGLSYIDIKNVHLFAATIETSASSHNIDINGISAKYVSEQMLNPIGWLNSVPTTGILLLGSGNTLQNSVINWSSGNGVYVGGSNNIVESCTITNTDYAGVDEAAITVVGSNQQLLYNTIHDTGRDGIRDSFSTNLRIEHNTLSNIGHQTTDLGAIYDYGNDSHGTVIAYNTISNIKTGGYGGDGIYLDNGSADFVVHDNVLNNVQIPIKLNSPSYSNSVYNNTVNGKKVAGGSSGGGSPAAGPITYKSKGATLVTLGTTGGFKSAGQGINNGGQVVGDSQGAANAPAFVDVNDTMSAVLPFATITAQANAMNASGQFVGQAFTGGNDVAYLDSKGAITNLGALPGDTTSDAAAINASGQIAGVSYGADSIARAFLYSKGAMQSLGTLGGSISQAFGVNDSVVVVGDSTLAGDASERAFSWKAGKMTSLGTLGGANSFATAINASGQIAGSSQISGNGAYHAFLDVNGKMKDLGVLSGYKNTIATAIDSAGDVVGYAYNTDTGTTHAFLYRNGVMIDLNSRLPANTGWTVMNATGINDKNQITGTAGNSTLAARAYVLTLLG
ncbi:MAG TPA: right-handed parallel beta-helix repeat-containing protein [Tepidisphaeraceae bacterium]|jgi:probable HAF family extracellular repeat protein|nr:right-handed parallel beta-helix repeat-containing protein [Tepidisphaeraceae bacterium]